MKYIRLEEESLYDGSQIKPMWAFKQFRIKDSSLISWIGPMDIKTDNLIDYEDVGLEIKGDKLLHFVIEHFDSQPADIRLCYHRQRLFVMIMKWGLKLKEKVMIFILKMSRMKSRKNLVNSVFP
jgi:hypothetical protein